jgi:hypothetical protein
MPGAADGSTVSRASRCALSPGYGGEESNMPQRYASFAEFYPLYLTEHGNRACRRLHFAGSVLVLVAIVVAAITGNAWWLLAAPVCGYGCAWIGHYFFEHNRPATFTHPVYSLIGDWAMFLDILAGKIPF